MKEKKYVKVIDSTYTYTEESRSLIGDVCEVADICYNDSTTCVYTKDKSDYWRFNFSDVQEVTGMKFNGQDICVGDEVMWNEIWRTVLGYFVWCEKLKIRTGTNKDTVIISEKEIAAHRPLYLQKVDTIEIAGRKFNKKEFEEATKGLKEVK